MSRNKLKALVACYDSYTLFHHVENGVVGPASNLTDDNIKVIFKSTLKDAKIKFMRFKKLIPENVLFFDIMNNSILFYTEPDFKMLHFTKELGVKSANYKTPFLLWHYKDNRLSVFALKRKPRNEKEKLFQAPFMNISSTGGVCMGNVKYGNEENYFDDLMEDIVDKFFNSYFSHTNCDDLLKMNYMTFLEENAENKNFSYSKYLTAINKTINDLI